MPRRRETGRIKDIRRRVASHLLAQLSSAMLPRIIAGRVPRAIPILHRLACMLELHPDAWWLIESEFGNGNSLESALDMVFGISRKVVGGWRRVLPLPIWEPWVDEDVDSHIARHFAHLL